MPKLESARHFQFSILKLIENWTIDKAEDFWLFSCSSYNCKLNNGNICKLPGISNFQFSVFNFNIESWNLNKMAITACVQFPVFCFQLSIWQMTNTKYKSKKLQIVKNFQFTLSIFNLKLNTLNWKIDKAANCRLFSISSLLFSVYFQFAGCFQFSFEIHNWQFRLEN